MWVKRIRYLDGKVIQVLWWSTCKEIFPKWSKLNSKICLFQYTHTHVAGTRHHERMMYNYTYFSKTTD